MGVVAKFRVNSVEAHEGATSTIKMSPVVAPTADERTAENAENEKFWSATPQGRIELTITNPPAAEQFQPSDEFYCTFERIPKPA